MSKRLNTEKRIIIIALLLFLVVGLLAVPGYGVGIDENWEIDTARLNLKEYVRLFFGEGSRLFQFMDAKIGNLMDSTEIDHGTAMIYPIACVVSVFREMGRADLGMLSYHIYLYVWFLAGCLAMYGLGKYLTGTWFWGACAAMFVYLHPLFFAASFTNNKDVLMMSLVSICMYLGIQFVEKKTWIWSVLWAISAACCTNLRIIGLAYAGLFGLLYLWEFLTAEKKEMKVFWNGVLAIAVMAGAFVAITPASWGSLWGYFTYTLSNTVGFTRWNDWILYRGELYSFLQKPLPWHYFFVWIGITTPLLILVSLILGNVNVARTLFHFKTENWDRNKYLYLCFIIVWLPMLFFVFHGANVYGKWRHFFFIYPELVLMAVCGLKWLSGKGEKSKKTVEILIGLEAAACIGILIVGHPFQESYFNILAGDQPIEDYGSGSTTEFKMVLEDILEMDDRDEIHIAAFVLNDYYGIKQAWEILSPEKKARIQIGEPDTEFCRTADYHVYLNYNLLMHNRLIESGLEEGEPVDPEELFSEKKEYGAYGNTIITVYWNRDESI